MKSTIGLLFAGGILFAGAIVPGCGGYGPEDYCNDACDCEGCSTTKHNDCNDWYDDLQRRADRDGCNKQWDNLANCANDTGHCTSRGVWEIDCNAETDSLAKCLGGDFPRGLPPL